MDVSANERMQQGVPAARPEDWLVGGGEMGRLIRSMDWSKTPLGPIEGWPQSLRTTVSLALSSKFPISIAWGPDYAQIYNDGYWPICGGKHPTSMGQNFAECWASAWPVIGEAFEQARRGESSFLENQRIFLDRNGYIEETFFTFSFSPIRDESGGIGGLFHPVTETTGSNLAQRRTRTLRDLVARTGKAQSVEEAFQLGAEALSACDVDLPFALFYLLDAQGAEARLVASTGLAPGSAASPAAVALEGAPGGWPLREAARTAHMLEVSELRLRFPGLGCGPYPEAPNAALVLPIPPPGAGRPVGLVIAGVSSRLPLDEAYRAFYELLAAGLTSAVANACAYEAERKRAEALAQIDRAKSLFFSNVSHEFRTPLTLMLGPLEDALDEQRGPLPPAVREPLILAHRNCLRLLKLVNTLLDFSRLEAGRIQASYQETDLPRATTELASLFRSAIERAGLTLSVHCEPLSAPALVDREMFEKILLNLLSNALKFTFQGGIEVTLHEDSGRAVLAVKDTGTGIPAEELPRVFERFHRVHGARARSHEGSGIGLALVQELVRLHGGDVKVESVVGQGSRFTVSLPLGSAHLPRERIGAARTQPSTGLGAAPFIEEALHWLPDSVDTLPEGAAAPQDGLVAASVQVPSRFRSSRVLFADDNADLRAYVVSLLKPHFIVEAVTNGQEALAAARARKPDLILTDVMMPILDGFALLREVRSDPTLRSTPVVLLSARAGEESKVEGLERGADDYLVKPFSARELVARVRTHLEMTEFREQITRHIATEEVLRASETKLRLALSAAHMGIWSWDLATGELHWSERCRELFAVAPDVVLTYQRFLDAVHPDDRERVDRAVQTALADRTDYDVEMRVLWPDGTVRWVASTGRRYDAGRGGYMTGVVRDVSERKRAEAEIAELTRSLEERVRTRTAELQTEVAHRRSAEERLAIILSSIGDGVIATDVAGLITHMNPVAEKLTGWSLGEAAGKPFPEVFHIVHENTRAPAPDPVARVLTERVTIGPANQTALIARQGAEYSIADIAAPILDRQDRLHGAVLVFRDVTETKAVERRFRRLLEAAPDAMVIINSEGRIVTVNKQACALFGYSDRELLGQPVELLIPERFRDGHAAHRRDYDTSPRVRAMGAGIQLFAQRKDGSLCPIEVVLSPIETRGERQIIAAVRDVTRRRELERFRDEYVGYISHDLKNPLSVISLQTRLLSRWLGEKASSESKHAVGVIAESAAFIDRLVRELLEMAYVESDQIQIHPEPIELAPFLRSVLERSVSTADSACIRLEIVEPSTVSAERRRIERVLVNFVQNAIKYSPPGSPITVRLEARDGRAVISVSDQGPGLTEAERAYVFDKYKRTESAQSKEGLGLGLYICRKIIEAHGGEIGVDSTPGKGATFFIRLPRLAPAPVTIDISPAAPPSYAALRGLKVLLVDDEVNALSALSMLLADEGLDVASASRGEQALKLAASKPPDVAVIDMKMPGMSGLELFQRLRERQPELPVVIMSGLMEQDLEVAKVRQSTRVAYVGKPVDVDELLRTLGRLFPAGSGQK